MKSEQMLDLKKSLLKDLLKQMDGGIVSSLRPVKETKSTLEEMGGEQEDEMGEECEMEETGEESTPEVEEESDIQKKLRQLFSSM